VAPPNDAGKKKEIHPTGELRVCGAGLHQGQYLSQKNDKALDKELQKSRIVGTVRGCNIRKNTNGERGFAAFGAFVEGKEKGAGA